MGTWNGLFRGNLSWGGSEGGNLSWGGSEGGGDRKIIQMESNKYCKDVLNVNIFKLTRFGFRWVEVNGKETTTLYNFLNSKKGGFLGDGIKWIFNKFFVDKGGKVVERYASSTSPLKMEAQL
ncbi:probable phospholipid hydroperoxide glutathione peroxidase [Asparagus officinalis]|uniref:probable phospholipid hydroperoxide glutathione peroxidase n=1 Tax=Asparagus officinalis TaxID=4686 RepID=UPI00098E36AA|nr:probable phospholipid hydroperoxide glutathione peroxidase [Asparagus officinalis]